MASIAIKRLAAPVRHFGLVFRAEMQRLVAYRVQFWCELILSSLVELFVACTVWRAVFEGRGQAAILGYSYPEMILYVTVAVFFGQAVRGTSVGTFARDIYDGSLTKYLVYPLSIYSYKLGTFLPRAAFALAQLAPALLLLWLLGWWPPEVTLSLLNTALALTQLLLAAALFFLLLFCVESGAFWADQVWALSVMLQIVVVLLSGKWVPLDMFPPALREALAYTPFPYLAFEPVQIFLGGRSVGQAAAGAGVLLMWLCIVFAFSRALYRRGLHRYTGVGI